MAKTPRNGVHRPGGHQRLPASQLIGASEACRQGFEMRKVVLHRKDSVLVVAMERGLEQVTRKQKSAYPAHTQTGWLSEKKRPTG
jgi:hypothetical protein